LCLQSLDLLTVKTPLDPLVASSSLELLNALTLAILDELALHFAHHAKDSEHNAFCVALGGHGGGSVLGSQRGNPRDEIGSKNDNSLCWEWKALDPPTWTMPLGEMSLPVEECHKHRKAMP
jgi:hypothetical protein